MQEIYAYVYLDKLLAVNLHVLNIDVSPEGSVPGRKTALNQCRHVPEALQHLHLTPTGLQLLELWHTHLKQPGRVLQRLHLCLHGCDLTVRLQVEGCTLLNETLPPTCDWVTSLNLYTALLFSYNIHQLRAHKNGRLE